MGINLLPRSETVAKSDFVSHAQSRWHQTSTLLLLCGTLLFGAGKSGEAQTAHLTGGQGMLGGDFSTVNVGVTSSPVSLTFSFDTAGTLGSEEVLTQGAPGFDFADTSTGTCAANTGYVAGQSCTVSVTFTPRFPGTRLGAVVLKDTSGNIFATGYLRGTGVGPQASFLPDNESVIPNTSLSNPHGIAVDGSGNLYVSDDYGVEKETYSSGSYSQSLIVSGVSGANLLAVDGAGNVYIADTGNMRVLKETPSASGYVESTVDSGFGYPYGVALDAAGNVYIAEGSVLKETPSGSGYTRSTAVSGVQAGSVAVDGDGNLFIASGGAILKETPSGSGYSTTTLPVAGQIQPNAVVVDGTGDVYFTDSLTYNVYKETPAPTGYVESAVVTDLHDILGPWGMAVDGSGKMYIAYLGGNSAVKADFAQAPTLNFAGTPVGTTSPDSPLPVTLENDGNAPLGLEIPSSGSNPKIDPNFTLDSSNPADCPTVTSLSSSPGYVAPGANCLLSISYTPQQPGPIQGSLVLTDNNLNAPAPGYASQSVTLNGTVVAPTFTLSPAPSSVSVLQGQSVSSTITITLQTGYSFSVNLSVSGLPSGVTATLSQNPANNSSVLTLNASSSASPGAATVTITGTFGSETETTVVNLQVNATPDYYLSVSTSPAYLTVGQGETGSASITTTVLHGYNSAITFTTCTPMPVGVSLTFTPSTVPAPGNGTSTMTFHVGSNVGVGSYLICLDVGGAGEAEAINFWLYVRSNPVITWATPAAIIYGTSLSAAQLNATASVPGTFAYSPAVGTVLSAGAQTLTVTFTPTDTTDYTTATASVSLTVNKATPVITWPAPAPVNYGTALSSTQLDATANVPGTFVYNPAAGSIPAAGSDTLSVAFTPTDTTDYATAAASVTLMVNHPSFTLSASPASLSISQGKSGASTISVIGAGGFAGSVNLTISGLPRGVTATFSSNPVTGSTLLTFKIAKNAPQGTTAILISGASGNLTASTTVSLAIVK
jgi:sugar lactone lactonase YvrE